MNAIKIFVLLIFTVLLTSCDPLTDDSFKECEIGYELIENECELIENDNPDPVDCDANPDDPSCIDDEPVVECEDNEMVHNGECVSFEDDRALGEKERLVVTDSTPEFDIEDVNLHTYEHPKYPGITYVDVEQFLAAIELTLVELTIIKELDIPSSEELVISHTLVDPDNENNVFTMSIRINPLENTIYFSDFNFLDYINNIDQEVTSLIEFELVEHTSTGEESQLIDLDNYGFDIIYVEDNFYLPLSVANLFLTGNYINTYRYNDQLHVVTDFGMSLDILEEETVTKEEEQYILLETQNYMALLFDYFYGLKEFNGVTSYKDTFEELGLYDLESLKEFNEELTKYFFLLDDLHTQVFDYGYNASDVDQGAFTEVGDKTSAFYQTLLTKCLVTPSNPVRLEDQGGHYILTITSFDENTPALLAAIFDRVEPGRDIYLDLSCNSGGLIYGALDLLQYMTDEPLDLKVTNPLTNEIVTTRLHTDNVPAIPNVFYVYTSPATFSAANLLTSIIQENALAITIGTRTSGGAAAVQYAVLPNNMVLTMSSNTVFLNQEEHIIEEPIMPDIYMVWGDVYRCENEVRSEIRYNMDYEFTIDSSAHFLDLAMDIDNTRLEMTSVNVSVYDTFTMELLFHTHLEGESFHLVEALPGDHTLVNIIVEVTYLYNDKEYTMNLMNYMVDDMPSEINDSVPLFEFGPIYTTTIHNSNDKDIFKIVLDEPTTFQVLIDGTTDEHVYMYYEDGTEFNTGDIKQLPAGTYYVEIDRYRGNYIFEYTIQLVELYDDYSIPVPITLQEGDNSVTLHYDFAGDKEGIEFTLEEEAIVEIIFDSWISSSYYIGIYGEGKLHSNSDNLHAFQVNRVLLPKGTYYLGFHHEMYGSPTANFNVTYKNDELSGSMDQPNPMFGSLIFGENTITFDEKWDTDIYEFIVTEAISLSFQFDGRFTMTEVDIDGNVVLDHTGLIKDFEPGTYYFRFQDVYSSDYPSTGTLSMVEVSDQSDETNMIPITLGEAFATTIEFDGDLDFFTFTIDDLSMVEIWRSNAHSMTWHIQDSDGNNVYKGSYNGGTIVQLVPGDYVLIVSEHISNYYALETYDLKLSIVDVEDEAPNITGLDPTMYQTFTFPFESPPIFDGALQYERDTDIFLLVVEEPGMYKLSLTGYIHVIVIDSNGESEFWRDNSLLQFEAGTYYVVVYNNKGYVVESYGFMLIDQNQT